jgi:hypothetical protein
MPLISGGHKQGFLARIATAIPTLSAESKNADDTARVVSKGKHHDIRTGDKACFRNHPDYKKRNPAGMWGGENVFCTRIVKGSTPEENQALWTGFGMAEKSEDQVFRALFSDFYDRHLDGPDEEAAYAAFRAHPDGPELQLHDATNTAYRINAKALDDLSR